jgi:SET domain-containing protein
MRRAAGRPRLFAVRGSAIHERGAFATRAIRRGSRIVEYLGERLLHGEADARYRDEGGEGHHTFLFRVDRDTVIDAAAGGNAARFLNHSCDPNCAVAIEKGRVFIDAIRDIAAGEELTYDYAFPRETADDDPRAAARFACRCGARRCRGTLLSPRAARG